MHVSIRSPHKSKGRPDNEGAPGLRPQVSIRSPHKSKGRHVTRPPYRQVVTFQSAPLTKARGDLGYYDRFACACGFNPLPSQKQGETEPTKRLSLRILVSIRSPHKSKGRLPYRGMLLQSVVVSIRSPHKSKGRPRSQDLVEPGCGFQSAPLTKARGDPTIWTYNAVLFVFQSAPLTKARGDRHTPSSVSKSMCFNPLPSQKQGETNDDGSNDDGSIVSIRSPHKSKGRRWTVRVFMTCWVFQSAPLTKARGDLVERAQAAAATGFNPLPSQKQGETAKKGWLLHDMPCFNPLPSQKQGETDGLKNLLKHLIGFNPLPSQKQGETRQRLLVRIQHTSFNPLPSQKQGETSRLRRVFAVSWVSIRSPHKSKGRPSS